MSKRITKKYLEIAEATTRYINITCLNNDTEKPFDFEGYTVQTHLSFDTEKQYVDTAIVDNILSYKIRQRYRWERKEVSLRREYSKKETYLRSCA